MQSESQNIEYKESWRDEYLKWICGFANAQGGTLYIGVNDDKKVVGVADSKRLMEDIPNKVSMSMGILVNVNLLHEDELEYISIEVQPSITPVGCKGKFYFRSGSTNQELTGIALENFLLKKNNLTWDGIPVDGTSVDDIDIDSVEYFVNRGIRYGRLPDSAAGLSVERILTNLHLIAEDGRLTYAALLLFGKKPQSYFIGAVFRIGRFGKDEVDILYQDEVAGNLIHMPDAVLDVLKGKYLKSYIRFEGLQRIEELEIPEVAMREILCNSIVHKDYRGVHTQMKVYDDRIRLWNEGSLMEGMTIETLRQEHNSRPRNKLIAQVFYLAGFIETWGRGIQKIDDAFKKAGLTIPDYSEIGGGILTIIPRPTANDSFVSQANDTKDNTTVHKELTERQRVIYDYISSYFFNSSKNEPLDEPLNTTALSQHLNIALATIKRDLRILIDKGLIRRVGGRKNGRWVIIE